MLSYPRGCLKEKESQESQGPLLMSEAQSPERGRNLSNKAILQVGRARTGPRPLASVGLFTPYHPLPNATLVCAALSQQPL